MELEMTEIKSVQLKEFAKSFNKNNQNYIIGIDPIDEITQDNVVKKSNWDTNINNKISYSYAYPNEKDFAPLLKNKVLCPFKRDDIFYDMVDDNKWMIADTPFGESLSIIYFSNDVSDAIYEFKRQYKL